MHKWPKLSTLILMAAISCSTITTSVDAIAQEANTKLELEEVIVTARKREENWQDVPISVSAISAETLTAAGIENAVDLVGHVPSLFVSYGDLGNIASSGFLVIRGVGATPIIEPAVGTFIDGVYQTALAFDMSFFNVERVEVLRGPQGTIYGRNTQGGALNIATRKPVNEFEGKVKVSYDDFETIDSQVVVSGPITDKLTFSLAGRYKDSDGYIDNITLHNAFDTYDEKSGRGRLYYEGDTVQVDLVAYTTDWSGGNRASGLLSQYAENYQSLDSDVEDSTRETLGGSLRFDVDLSNYVLTSITAASEIDNTSFDDTDSGPTPGNIQTFTYANDAFSQELRLASDAGDKLAWTVGAFYFDEDRFLNQLVASSPLLQPPEILATGLAGLQYDADTLIKRQGYAFFGQLDYAVSDRLDLSLGLRYSDEDVDLAVELPTFATLPSAQGAPLGTPAVDLCAVFASLGNLCTPPYANDASFDAITWMTSANYALSDEASVYATVSKGFKAGGFQDFIVFEDETEPFDNEFSTNYELGIKSGYWSGRGTLSAAVYYVDISDQQIKVRTITGFLPSNVTLNIGSSHTSGFEFETSALLAEGLTAHASLGWVVDADYDDIGDVENSGDGFDVSVLEGTRFANVPEITASASLDYLRPLSATLNLHLYADFRYIDDYVASYSSDPLDSVDDISLIPSYTLTNFSVGVEGANWKATLFVRNAFDEVTPVVRGDSSLLSLEEKFVMIEPRLWGASIEWSF